MFKKTKSAELGYMELRKKKPRPLEPVISKNITNFPELQICR